MITRAAGQPVYIMKNDSDLQLMPHKMTLVLLTNMDLHVLDVN